MRNYKRLNDKERHDLRVAHFWSRTDKSGACWIWTGPLGPRGYGNACFMGRTFRAHRLAWQLANGDIPDGLFVCHRCDNRLCVRPEHLFLGTHQDNVDDMMRKGRHNPGTALRSLQQLHERREFLLRNLAIIDEQIAAHRASGLPTDLDARETEAG